MFDKNNYKQKMNKTFEAFTKDLSTLRTGRANASMLDTIKVDVYGQKMPINQLGTITTPEPKSLNIQVWDQNNVTLIDSSIRKSEIGLNPQIDGQLIRIPIPNLNEETKNELKKINLIFFCCAKSLIKNLAPLFSELVNMVICLSKKALDCNKYLNQLLTPPPVSDSQTIAIFLICNILNVFIKS